MLGFFEHWRIPSFHRFPCVFPRSYRKGKDLRSICAAFLTEIPSCWTLSKRGGGFTFGVFAKRSASLETPLFLHITAVSLFDCKISSWAFAYLTCTWETPLSVLTVNLFDRQSVKNLFRGMRATYVFFGNTSFFLNFLSSFLYHHIHLRRPTV